MTSVHASVAIAYLVETVVAVFRVAESAVLNSMIIFCLDPSYDFKGLFVHLDALL